METNRKLPSSYTTTHAQRNFCPNLRVGIGNSPSLLLLLHMIGIPELLDQLEDFCWSLDLFESNVGVVLF
jgi:hypothetical protein